MASDTPLSSWKDIVPEFYFDLISRVPPGLLLTLALLQEFDFLDGALARTHGESMLNLFSCLILFMIGYSVGIFLSVPGTKLSDGIFFRLVDNAVSENPRLFVRFLALLPDSDVRNSIIRKLVPLITGRTAELHEEFTEEDRPWLYRNLHEWLKLNNAQALIMLPKLGAESALCFNSMAALIVGCACYLIRATGIPYHAIQVNWWYLFLSILLCGLLLWVGEGRLKRQLRSHISFLNATLEALAKR